MKRLQYIKLIALLIPLLNVYSSYGQQRSLTGPNAMTIKLTTAEGQLSLKTKQARVTYESGVGYLQIIVPFRTLRKWSKGTTSNKLWKSFKETEKEGDLNIRIELNNSPLDLGRLEKGRTTGVRVLWRNTFFKNEVQLKGFTVKDNLIFNFRMNHQFGEATFLTGLKNTEVQTIEFVSESMRLTNFSQLRN